MGKLKARTSRRGRFTLPEACLAAGPQGGEGVTGDGSYNALFAGRWALVLSKDGLELLQLQNGAWVSVQPLNPLPVLGRNARHLAFCFDKAARPVIAWEDAGAVWVSQFQPGQGFVSRGPFAGHDPVLVQDATIGGGVNDSDVQLYHLTTDRLGLVARIQRDLYAIATAMQTFAQPATLDQATSAAYALTLWGDFSTAETLKSTPYPMEVLVSARSRPKLLSVGVLDILTLRLVALAATVRPSLLSATVVNMDGPRLIAASALTRPKLASGKRMDVLTVTSPALAALVRPSLKSGANREVLTKVNIEAGANLRPALKGGSLANA